MMKIACECMCVKIRDALLKGMYKATNGFQKTFILEFSEEKKTEETFDI